MPVNFQFVSKETGEAVKLPAIDEEMCKFMGTPCHEKYFSVLYEVATNIGIFATGRGAEVTEESFLAYVEKHKDRLKLDEPKNEKLLAGLRKFLFEDYTFRAWRGRR